MPVMTLDQLKAKIAFNRKRSEVNFDSTKFNDHDGHWIQIGAEKGEDGKKHGGSPVFVKGGTIEKGPPNLTGAKLEGHKLNPTANISVKPSSSYKKESSPKGWKEIEANDPSSISPEGQNILDGLVDKYDPSKHSELPKTEASPKGWGNVQSEIQQSNQSPKNDLDDIDKLLEATKPKAHDINTIGGNKIKAEPLEKDQWKLTFPDGITQTVTEDFKNKLDKFHKNKLQEKANISAQQSPDPDSDYGKLDQKQIQIFNEKLKSSPHLVKAINSWLNGGTCKELRKQDNGSLPKTETYEHFMQVYNDAPKYNGEAYRGAVITKDVYDKISEGGVFTFNSISSFSLDHHEAEVFAYSSDPNKHKIIYKAKGSFKALYPAYQTVHSFLLKEEKELLAHKSSSYKVAKKEIQGDITYIHLEEIPDAKEVSGSVLI